MDNKIYTKSDLMKAWIDVRSDIMVVGKNMEGNTQDIIRATLSFDHAMEAFMARLEMNSERNTEDLDFPNSSVRDEDINFILGGNKK